MSMTLLKQSIAILEEDLPKEKKPKSKGAKPEVTKKAGGAGKKFKGNIVDKIERQPKFNILKIKSDLEEKSGKAEENALKLLRLSQTTMKPEVAQKLLQRGRTGRYVVEVEKPKEELESLYTEEDFLNFEKEYFGS